MRTLLILLAALVSIVPVAVADELAPGVSLIRGAFVPGSQPDGNTVFLAGPDGLVVVDTGRHVEHTSAIVEFVRAGGKPLAAIVNTHWHLDHIGGNALLRSEFPGVRVHASGTFAGARTRFVANYRAQLEDLCMVVHDRGSSDTVSLDGPGWGSRLMGRDPAFRGDERVRLFWHHPSRWGAPRRMCRINYESYSIT